MLQHLIINKPDPSEYPQWFAHEIEPILYDDLLLGLKDSLQESLTFLKTLTPENLTFRYAPDKWSIKQVWQHIIDIERIMCYRALRYARQDATVLSGLDQNKYAETALADARDWTNILKEYEAVRAASVALFRSFTAEMFDHRGTTGRSNMTVRAMGYVIIGHEIHHLKIIRERYLGQ